MNNKITAPEIIKKSIHYYSLDGNSSGGNLHIVLDDGNIENSSIEFCMKKCIENNDLLGLELCQMLLSASKTQRKKIYNNI
jgi:hypothetical protein